MKVEAKINGQWINIPNAGAGTTLTRPLNGIAIFRINIDKPTIEQIDSIKDGTEIQIYDNDFTFLGVVRKTRASTNRLEIEGTGYEITLNNIMINASNTSLEDTSLSSGYTVVYNNQDFRDVVIDILNGTGITATSSTVDTIGNINIKFKNTYVLEAIKKLADLSGYYWWVDSSKVLHMESSRGSSTPVTNINLYGEGELLEEYIDRNRMCNKAIVFGAGEAYGEASDSTSISTYGLKEGRFKFPELQTNTECTQRAQKIVNEFKDPIHIVKIATLRKGYDLGDTVYLFGREIDGNYRVTKITYDITGRREIELTSSGLKHRTDEFYEEIERLLKQGSSNIAEITTGDKIEELVYGHVSPTSTSNYFRFRFYIDPEKVSDVLQAKLYVVRDYIDMPYGTETDGSYAYFSQAAHDHSQNAPGQNDHDHDIAGQTTGYVLTGQSVLSDIDRTTYVYGSGGTSGQWVTVCSGVGVTAVNHESLEGSVNITDQGTNAYNYYYVRLYYYCGYWPDSTGVPVRIEGGKSGSVYLRFPVHGINCSTIAAELQVFVPSGTSAKMSGYLLTAYSHQHEVSAHVTQGSQADILPGTPTTGELADITDNQHTNPLIIDVRKYDDGLSHKVNIYVDGNYLTYKYLTGIGDTFEIDISTDISTTGWHTIELRPTTGNMFISAQAKVKVFKIE